MEKFIKFCICITACIFAFLLYTPTVCHAAEDSSRTAVDDFSSQIDKELQQSIDEDTRGEMESMEISGDPKELTLGGILKSLWEKLTGMLTLPIRTLGRLAAVIILSSLVKSTADGGASQTFRTVSVLGSIIIIYQTIYAAFESVCAFLDRLVEFMLAYIPIYASVTAASGSYSSGGSYYATTLGICELIGFISQGVLMPFLSIFLALAFTSAINPDMKFSTAAESIKNAVHFALTALMTIFTGLISIQSLSGSAADGAAARAVKFGASNFIPIIGGSVSEAYSTVYASIGVIRTGVGSVGMTVIFVMLSGPLCELICAKLVTELARILSELLGTGEISELLKSAGAAVSAAISTVLCFAMMFMVSTAIVMLTAANLSL